MLVMAMRRAITAPMPPPIASPPRIRPQVRGSETPATHRVVRMAITMPIMPLRLPVRLVAGDASPFSARMNRTPATRYSRAAISAWFLRALSLLIFLLVHRQHAAGDQEAAEDIHRCQDQREEAQDLGGPGAAVQRRHRHR